MIYNDAELSLDVNSRTKQMISTGIQFSTQDVNTARIIFTVTKDGERLPLSSVVGKLVMIMADGSRFVRNVDIVDKVEGVAQYVLSEDEIKHYGNVQAELNLYYTNEQSLSVHKFSFVIDQALIDSNITPVAEYYIDDFESLKSAIQEIVGEMNQTLAELEEKFSNLENIETKTGAQAKADKALADAKVYTDDHANRTDNPHEVTKEQVGLSNVVNSEQATKTEFTEHVEDNVRHVTSEERDKWNGTSDVARFEALGQLSLILKGSLYLKNDYNFFGYLSNGDHSNLATMEQNDIAKFGDAKAVTWLAGKDYVSVRSPKMYLVEKSDEGGNAVTPASLYERLDIREEFQMFFDQKDRYLELWKAGVKRLFNFLKEDVPNCKVIINKARFIDEYIDKETGETKIISESGKKRYINVPVYNKWWDALDNHVIKNYDVKVIDYQGRHYKSIEDHPWDMFYVHYDMSFYQDFSRQLLTIALEDALKDKGALATN